MEQLADAFASYKSQGKRPAWAKYDGLALWDEFCLVPRGESSIYVYENHKALNSQVSRRLQGHVSGLL